MGLGAGKEKKSYRVCPGGECPQALSSRRPSVLPFPGNVRALCHSLSVRSAEACCSARTPSNRYGTPSCESVFCCYNKMPYKETYLAVHARGSVPGGQGTGEGLWQTASPRQGCRPGSSHRPAQTSVTALVNLKRACENHPVSSESKAQGAVDAPLGRWFHACIYLFIYFLSSSGDKPKPSRMLGKRPAAEPYPSPLPHVTKAPQPHHLGEQPSNKCTPDKPHPNSRSTQGARRGEGAAVTPEREHRHSRNVTKGPGLVACGWVACAYWGQKHFSLRCSGFSPVKDIVPAAP